MLGCIDECDMHVGMHRWMCHACWDVRLTSTYWDARISLVISSVSILSIDNRIARCSCGVLSQGHGCQVVGWPRSQHQHRGHVLGADWHSKHHWRASAARWASCGTLTARAASGEISLSTVLRYVQRRLEVPYTKYLLWTNLSTPCIRAVY